jgi:IS5 family transposase
MKPKRVNHNQGSLLETRLSELLDPQNRLRLLADLIDWEELEGQLSIHFSNEKGAPGKPIRLVSGVLMLQHMTGLSDEQMAVGWVQNPYWQYFCGYDYLQWRFPMDPSSLSRWRKRLGEEGLEKILQATLKLALRIGIVKTNSYETVIVDTTVMEKNIAYPTDARLYYRSLQKLVREAKRHGIVLRQTYTFLSKQALRKTHQYAHARQMKRAKREMRRLRTYLGRVHRDIRRQIEKQKALQNSLMSLLKITNHILHQQKTDKDKIYSVHEPEVECISKGKAHKKYEFGCKTSIVLTHKEGLVLSMNAMHGKPYDGHTLEESLERAESQTGTTIKRGFVDKGYRGHSVENKEIYITGKRGLSRHYKNMLKRRQAIEPHIGHMKNDGKLDRNYLKGKLGDLINAVLCGIGHNLRLILNKMHLQAA